MTMEEIEALRAKGWHFQFTGDQSGWSCQVVALGLAHGDAGGETLELAAEAAMKQVRAMEDDPKVLIEAHGAQVEKLAKEIFGEKAFQGIEPVESPEPGEPVRIAMSILQTVEPGPYVELELKFLHRMFDEFPRDFIRAFIIEVDYPEEKAKA